MDYEVCASVESGEQSLIEVEKQNLDNGYSKFRSKILGQ